MWVHKQYTRGKIGWLNNFTEAHTWPDASSEWCLCRSQTHAWCSQCQWPWWNEDSRNGGHHGSSCSVSMGEGGEGERERENEKKRTNFKSKEGFVIIFIILIFTTIIIITIIKIIINTIITTITIIIIIIIIIIIVIILLSNNFFLLTTNWSLMKNLALVNSMLSPGSLAATDNSTHFFRTSSINNKQKLNY